MYTKFQNLLKEIKEATDSLMIKKSSVDFFKAYYALVEKQNFVLKILMNVSARFTGSDS